MLLLSPDALAGHDANRPGGPHHARCLAPFTSMYFDQFGNVLACCINTVQPMGAYPRQRVADIWSGIAAKSLRAALAADDFSMGCHDCHSSISCGNYNAVNASFDEQAAATSEDWLAQHPPVQDDRRDPWPRMLEFSLSTRCNLRCTMCSGYCSSAIRKAEGLEPLPELYGDAFIAEIRPFLEQVEAVKFFGGEPFLAPVNFTILEILEEVNPTCRVAITTNGTIWNDRVRRAVANLDVSITVSLDAATTKTFESIRLGADHQKVLANLERFASVERCSVGLTVCAMRQNWREIPDLVRLANDHDWPMGVNVVRYPQDHSLSSASVEELASVVELWDRTLTAERQSGSASMAAHQNLSTFANILAEVQDWRDAADPQASGVEIRTGSAAGARARRTAWLDLVSTLADSTWTRDAADSEAAFTAELDRLIVRFEANVDVDAQGDRVAAALAGHVAGPLDHAIRLRFDRLGGTLSAASVADRLRRFADLPPELLAEGVAHEDPDVLAMRIDSFFPPTPQQVVRGRATST